MSHRSIATAPHLPWCRVRQLRDEPPPAVDAASAATSKLARRWTTLDDGLPVQSTRRARHYRVRGAAFGVLDEDDHGVKGVPIVRSNASKNICDAARAAWVANEGDLRTRLAQRFVRRPRPRGNSAQTS